MVSNTNADVDRRKSNGKVVFVYDDSPEEDYTKTFPVHQEEGVPGCVAAVSSAINTDRGLSLEQLTEIASSGWEVMSHTVRHRPLGSYPITETIESGDSKVYSVANDHGAYPGDRIRVFDDRTHETVTVSGRGTDGVGTYVTTEEEFDTSFGTERTEFRYVDERLRESLRRSKADLERHGFEVSSLVLPYDLNGSRLRELVPEYYAAVPNATWQTGLNRLESLDPYDLHRAYFRSGAMTERELASYLDAVAERDVLGILAGHSAYDSFAAERVRTAIRMAKERNVEILTLREALTDLGVFERTTQTDTPTTATDTPSTPPPTTATDTRSGTPSPTTDSLPSRGTTAAGNGSTGFLPEGVEAERTELGALAVLAGVGALAARRIRGRR